MPIKKILVLIVLITAATLGSAQRTYTKEWKRIDSLIEKAGLIKSALKEVSAIYVNAKKENNDVQVIRSLLYRMSLNDQLSDSGRYKIIELIENEIATAKEPARSILHSIAGGNYWHYLQMNRWQFYNRSNTKGYDNKDISTWSLEQLYERITTHYDSSLYNKKLLTTTKLDKFDPIIIKGNARHLRPTLFDLLAFRALDYYRNDERYITKPAYAFEINDSVAYADAGIFIRHKFNTSDSLSLHHKALEVYQQLLAFHINDVKPDALIDADLNRLEFVKNFGTHLQKDDLYKKAIENIIAKYEKDPIITNAIYYLAEWYMEKGSSYDPLGDTTHRYSISRAKELCEKAIAMKVANEGTVNCKNLNKRIMHRNISMKGETVNTIGDPFRVLLNYRNITNACIRIIKLDREVRNRTGMNSWEDEFWNKVVALPVIKTLNFSLPATNDYQAHRVEIKIDPLPAGEYGILLSPDKDFPLQKNALALQHVYVSDISYVNNGNRYHVLNRKSGGPLSSAKVQLWEEFYNQTKRSMDTRKLETYSTDAKGFLEIKKGTTDNLSRNIFLDISHGSDRLFLFKRAYEYIYDGGHTNQDSIKEEIILFTDRSIYRPGQTVFFKGIAITRRIIEKNNSVIPNRKSKIILFNNNGETIDSVELFTNEFGSYSGKFTLPSGLLNGEFSINDIGSGNNTIIRVEEYKRPKFHVEIAPPKGTYRVNDTINVEGNAVSYAGNNINGATVKYRVMRRAMVPMWTSGYSPRIWPPYPQEQMEITHGTTITNENGIFTIHFTAIPDNKIPRSTHSIFNYTITTDVTDVNGETRSGSTSVSIAYTAMKLNLNVPASLHTDSLKEISVSSTNMNDSFVRAAVKILMYKLNAPQKIFRKRYWEQPDQFIMGRDEYYKNFPHDLYSDETDKSKWTKQNALIDLSVTTAPGSNHKLKKTPFEAGWYLVEAWTKDKFGDTVIDKKYILLYNNKLMMPEAGSLLIADKSLVKPGDKVKYGLITNIDSLLVIRELLHNSGIKKDLISIQKNNAGSVVMIDESDRGGVLVKTVFVKNNRVYSDLLDIAVPFLNKQLKIEYITYRDKTIPGSNEKWKVKIGGMKGENVVAELIASMYDASLDQFYPHKWKLPLLWEGTLDQYGWSGRMNFMEEESVQKNYYEEEENFVAREYDRLISPEEGGVGYLSARTSSRLMEARPPVVAQDGSGGAVANLASESKQNNKAYDSSSSDLIKPTDNPPASIQPRKNLNETAFFFPDLHTDSSGNVEFSFTSPEALTTWNWMLFAHTPGLAYAYGEKKIITQKQLMVQSNAPRFLREGDSINFSVKVANLSEQNISGQASLQLFDPLTGKEVNGLVSDIQKSKKFNAAAGLSIPLTFTIKIPSTYTSPLTWRVIAISNNNDISLNDGEEDIIPVLSNRLLVTETIALPVREQNSKSFRFEKLLNSDSGKTLKHKALTIEFTSNPAWYAVQALPYLSEVKNENAEQIFNSFYANAIASKIVKNFPKLKAIIDKWQTADTSAFLSNLQKNQDLKNILLQETPWVLEAKTEAQQKKNVALLFDMSKMSLELTSALNKLTDMQTTEGGFVWYKNGQPDRYMTQYIVSGIGHLKKLGAIPGNSNEAINHIARNAIAYLDNELKRDYDRIKKANKKVGGINAGNESPIQYLYMRSFFKDLAVPGDVFTAYNFFRNQVKHGWVKQNTYMRAMIALSLQRTGDSQTAKKIIAALKESAIENEENGMYWKDMTGGYNWYQAPIETQSVLIEAFSEITSDEKAVAGMKTWLLKNKQTNSWKTTKATADACYALLLKGEDWITGEITVTINLGEKIISSSENAETGTGYFRNTIDGDSVKSEMGIITVNLKTDNNAKPAWGGVYWQYFEDLDRITTAATSLKIDKKLFVQKNTDRGQVIEALDKNNTLHVGDRVKVRIEIRTDRNMEYVHLKDMRSSSMEPVNILSQYKWQGGLGYYEISKDASTNFFFNYLPKGTHVFEYDLLVSHTGKFSNGVAIIQCMYAPEFSSHSEGIKVNVVK